MKNPFELKNKSFLVTGASSGIGRQICISISNAGGNVIASGRNECKLCETMKMLHGEGHVSLQADLCESENIERLADNIGKVDGIVFCAGVIKYIPLKFMTDSFINDINQINYISPLILLQRISKKQKLNKNSSIIFISSISGVIGGAPGISAYAASKAALNGAARILALEYATQGTRVNCIAPGMIRTPMSESISKTISEESLKKDELNYPLGYGTPEDVANSTVFMLSDASKWMTGTTLILDGGLSCK